MLHVLGLAAVLGPDLVRRNRPSDFLSPVNGKIQPKKKGEHSLSNRPSSSIY